MSELYKKIDDLIGKVDYLTQLMENHIMVEKKPGENPMQQALKILEKTPMAQHPILKTFIDGMKEQEKNKVKEASKPLIDRRV